jgi:acyl-homoserine-lactone acylase
MRGTILFLLSLSLLSAQTRGVDLLWDKFGVGHVYAKNAEGIFYGYGYAQMQSHANLILKLYGESRGRGAEYWGEKNLELDRWVHTNEIPERAETWFTQQTPEFQRYLTAFADGMNEYAKRHPEAIGAEYKQVLPIRPVDSLMHVHRIVHFSYVSSQARALSAGTGRSFNPGALASNAWAIAPAKSANATPMMLMNPHLPWQDWYTYYEIHLNAPGINLYGASQIGFPVLRFVFSDHIGFTQTVNSLDGSDLYQITPEGSGYRFDGAVKEFETRSKTLKVRTPTGTLRQEALTIRKTVHGPIVFDDGKKILAQRTVALDRPFLLEQYWKMALAKNFNEYETQLKRLQVPTFNITYADKAGHVMYFYNGTVPKRKSGDVTYWAGVLPGDTSATLWSEVHPYEDLPKVIDPPSGWVQNTNDPPWTGTLPALDHTKFPAYIAGRDYSARTMSSLRMLSQPGKMSFDQLIANKHSTHLELADRLFDGIPLTPRDNMSDITKRAVTVLGAWDRNADNQSKGALLFEAFARKLMGPALADKSVFATPFDPADPLHTPRGLKDHVKAMAALEAAALETEKTYGSLDASWGDFMRFRFRGADLPGNGADGGLGAFRVVRFGGPATSKQKAPVHGDTFVAAVEWLKSGPHAQVLVSYGNSSQPGTKHDIDQLPLLSAKKLRTAWRLRKDVEANLESKDKL